MHPTPVWVGVCVCAQGLSCAESTLCGHVWPGVCLWVSAPGVHSSGSACQTGVYVFEAGHACVGVPAILVSSGPRSL